ncbi:MAG: hypothetical protein Q8P15_02600 [Nanoarchaeota archaeon]|nr:hypothetical protein [Nanoarchaeota archaeon]
MIEKEVLIVGADDSNHSGISKMEIIATTFSFLNKDSIVTPFPNYRNLQGYLKWIENPERDYRFEILASEKYRYSSTNLVKITPSLINSFLEDNDFYVKTLKIYLDGRLERDEKDFLRNIFTGRKGIEKVVVGNFIKKNKNTRGNISKRPNCPAVVYYADILAHYLYPKSFEELSQHEKLVCVR